MKHDLLLFLGRFHPLLVHLPIGGLVLLGFLELVAALTQRPQAAQARRWMAGFVAAAAAASAAAGWILAQEGGYAAQLLKWHRALGLALAGTCLLTSVLCYWERLWAYRASLATTLALLVVVSHLGGSITHGPDFLTRYAPIFSHARAGLLAQDTGAASMCPPMQKPVFEGVIEPILRQRCMDCHGTDKQKAGLRLDNAEACLRGGHHGPVIKPGHADDSPLMQRLLLPIDADGHMPPEDQPQLSTEEIALLEWWINAGAPTRGKVADLKPKPEITRILELVSARPAQHN